MRTSNLEIDRSSLPYMRDSGQHGRLVFLKRTQRVIIEVFRILLVNIFILKCARSSQYHTKVRVELVEAPEYSFAVFMLYYMKILMVMGRWSLPL